MMAEAMSRRVMRCCAAVAAVAALTLPTTAAPGPIDDMIALMRTEDFAYRTSVACSKALQVFAVGRGALSPIHLGSTDSDACRSWMSFEAPDAVRQLEMSIKSAVSDCYRQHSPHDNDNAQELEKCIERVHDIETWDGLSLYIGVIGCTAPAIERMEDAKRGWCIAADDPRIHIDLMRKFTRMEPQLLDIVTGALTDALRERAASEPWADTKQAIARISKNGDSLDDSQARLRAAGFGCAPLDANTIELERNTLRPRARMEPVPGDIRCEVSFGGISWSIPHGTKRIQPLRFFSVRIQQHLRPSKDQSRVDDTWLSVNWFSI